MPSRPQSHFLTIREFGAIGNGVAFAMGVAAARPDDTVVLFDGDGRARAMKDGQAVTANRAAFFAGADVVSLHDRLKPETRGIVTEADLLAMKPSAIFVNTSRAALVAPEATSAALSAGRPGTIRPRRLRNRTFDRSRRSDCQSSSRDRHASHRLCDRGRARSAVCRHLRPDQRLCLRRANPHGQSGSPGPTLTIRACPKRSGRWRRSNRFRTIDQAEPRQGNACVVVRLRRLRPWTGARRS